MTEPLISKSKGLTETESLLARLCERTFLKLWSYPNPFKADKKELCDLLAVFDNHAFVFFDRRSPRLDCDDEKFEVQWARWKRKVIDDQIRTAKRAEIYLRGGSPVYLDNKCIQEFPLGLGPDMIIHKIIVAHGAAEACKRFSAQNEMGSLAVSYGKRLPSFDFPFSVELDRDECVHVFDSENLEIVFGELDTLADFLAYITEKERVIAKYDLLAYCGEEDLLSRYFLGWDDDEQRYRLDPKDKGYNGIFIDQGAWASFKNSEPYRRRLEANAPSYFWDEIIQKTCGNALNGTLQGDADLLNGRSAIHEMAREPRLFRRLISERMIKAITGFPDEAEAMMRHVTYGPSFDEGKAYIFLQVYVRDKGDYDTEYRPVRREMLRIACGSAKNRFPHLKTVVGIAIDAPKISSMNSEDFILMDLSNWTPEEAAHYRQDNQLFNFFQSPTLAETKLHISEFPAPESRPQAKKVGRNAACPCGSGKKSKKCCRR